MNDPELIQFMEDDHHALTAFVRGDPELKKRLYSRQDDVTLADPLGPPVRGWAQVEQALERAASHLRDGEVLGFERISGYATADLAYRVEIERLRARFGADQQIVSTALRVTMIFRREADGWKIVHRHADPITSARPMESIVQP
jgi:ketosteroid isomerase-like protein